VTKNWPVFDYIKLRAAKEIIDLLCALRSSSTSGPSKSPNRVLSKRSYIYSRRPGFRTLRAVPLGPPLPRHSVCALVPLAHPRPWGRSLRDPRPSGVRRVPQRAAFGCLWVRSARHTAEVLCGVPRCYNGCAASPPNSEARTKAHPAFGASLKGKR